MNANGLFLPIFLACIAHPPLFHSVRRKRRNRLLANLGTTHLVNLDHHDDEASERENRQFAIFFLPTN